MTWWVGRDGVIRIPGGYKLHMIKTSYIVVYMPQGNYIFKCRTGQQQLEALTSLVPPTFQKGDWTIDKYVSKTFSNFKQAWESADSIKRGLKCVPTK